MGPFDFINPSAPALNQTPVTPLASPTAPVAAPPVAAPAPQPEQDGIRGAWTQFFDQLKTNPQLQQALLHGSATLMQGQRPGERFGGLLGRAVQTGSLASQFIKQNQLNAGQKQQEIDHEGNRVDIQGRVADSTIESQGAQAEASRASTRRAGKLLPSEITRNEASAKESTAKAGVAEKLADASVTEANARAVEAEARALLAGKTNPSIDDNTATLQSLATRYPNEDAGEISGRFLRIQQEARLSPLVRSAQAIMVQSLDPAEKKQAKEFLDAQYRRILGQEERDAKTKKKTAPKGMAAPKDLVERDALPSKTEYWDKYKEEVRVRP